MLLTDLIPIPRDINIGLSPLSNKMMLNKYGNPRNSYSEDCQPITNKVILPHIIRKNVGPFNVTGYDKAVYSLEDILSKIKTDVPDVYKVLGTAGMLCCRYVRGSTTSISNHSWGFAIDLMINSKLDERGNKKVQLGLALIHKIFNDNGWFWGAGFTTEDAMHFECSSQLVNSWPWLLINKNNMLGVYYETNKDQ